MRGDPDTSDIPEADEEWFRKARLKMNDNERWHTYQQGEDAFLIIHGNRVVGSIVRREARWHVEILWSGPSGDIKGHSKDYASALAFVNGVEQTLMALGLHHPELNIGKSNDDLASGSVPPPPHIR
jgi:hypothetical protein